MLQCISKEKWRIKSDRVKLVSVHKSFVVPSEGLKCLNQTELEPSSTGHMFRIWPKLLLYIHRESCRSFQPLPERRHLLGSYTHGTSQFASILTYSFIIFKLSDMFVNIYAWSVNEELSHVWLLLSVSGNVLHLAFVLFFNRFGGTGLGGAWTLATTQFHLCN